MDGVEEGAPKKADGGTTAAGALVDSGAGAPKKELALATTTVAGVAAGAEAGAGTTPKAAHWGPCGPPPDWATSPPPGPTMPSPAWCSPPPWTLLPPAPSLLPPAPGGPDTSPAGPAPRANPGVVGPPPSTSQDKSKAPKGLMGTARDPKPDAGATGLKSTPRAPERWPWGVCMCSAEPPLAALLRLPAGVPATVGSGSPLAPPAGQPLARPAPPTPSCGPADKGAALHASPLTEVPGSPRGTAPPDVDAGSHWEADVSKPPPPPPQPRLPVAGVAVAVLTSRPPSTAPGRGPGVCRPLELVGGPVAAGLLAVTEAAGTKERPRKPPPPATGHAPAGAPTPLSLAPPPLAFVGGGPKKLVTSW